MKKVAGKIIRRAFIRQPRNANAWVPGRVGGYRGPTTSPYGKWLRREVKKMLGPKYKEATKKFKSRKARNEMGRRYRASLNETGIGPGFTEWGSVRK